jgi:transcriptional regulator NrdR family protein
MADLTTLKVQKKDGTQDPYDRQKVLTSVMKAGGTPEQAEQVAQAVDAWATSSLTDVVTTSDIRAKLLEALKSVNQTAAESFEAYVKPAPVSV